ncbi:MAG: hypothetical protein JOZ69_12065 [Myxococcales bacterium]|nr:hypothetical protein [Myxococcales bacterium]
MSTCRRWEPVLLLVLLCAAFASCGAESGDCLRFTDCAEGLTCAAGRCVVPPPPASASGSDGAAPAVSTGDGGAVRGGGDDAADEPGLFDDAGSGLFDDDAPGG